MPNKKMLVIHPKDNVGVVLEDVTTRRLFDKWDMEFSYINNLTNGTLQNYKLPMVMPDDRRAILAAIHLCRLPDTTRARIVRIPNTLQLSRLQISEALLDEARALGLSVCGEAEDLVFGEDGALLSPISIRN